MLRFVFSCLPLSSPLPVLFWDDVPVCVSSLTSCLCPVSPPLWLSPLVPHVFQLCSIIPASPVYISLSACLGLFVVFHSSLAVTLCFLVIPVSSCSQCFECFFSSLALWQSFLVSNVFWFRFFCFWTLFSYPVFLHDPFVLVKILFFLCYLFLPCFCILGSLWQKKEHMTHLKCKHKSNT